MPTRSERLAQQEVRAKARLEAQKQQLAQVQARQRAENRKDLARRRYLVGQMVEEAGLFALSDADLAALLAALSGLADVPNPGAVLESLLCDVGVAPGMSVMATPISCVDGVTAVP